MSHQKSPSHEESAKISWAQLPWIGWVVAFAVLVALGVNGWLTYRQYYAIDQTVSAQPHGLDVWDIAQLQRQMLRFQVEIAAIAESGIIEDHAELTLQWDLVWSRIKIIDEGETSKGIGELSPDINKFPEIERLIRDIDASFQLLLEQPAVFAPIVQTNLDRAVRLSQEMHALTYNNLLQDLVRVTESLKWIQLETIVIGVIFVSLVFLLIAIIWRTFRSKLGQTFRLVAELEKSEERYRILAEGSIQGIVVHKNFRPEFVNQSFASMFGYKSPQEVLDLGDLSVLATSPGPQRLKEYYDDRMGDRYAPAQYTVQGVRKDGKPIWVEIMAKVIDWDGEPAVQATIFNITDRKLAEEGQARVVSILEATPDLVGICDLQGRLTFINQAGRKMLGLHPGQDISVRTLADYHTPASQNMLMDVGIPSAVENGVWKTNNAELVSNNGDIIPVSQIFIAHKNSRREIEYLSFICRDITALKETDRLKSEFVSIVAHELRTPLSSIRASLKLLSDEIITELAPESAELLQIAEANTNRLIRLIGDILDLEKIVHGKHELSMSSVDLRNITKAVLAELAPMAVEAEVTIVQKLDAEVYFAGDRDRIIQVISNLVGNAIKFSPGGSTIEVGVGQPAEGGARFSVQDQGPGIAPEKQSKLFGRFQQLDSTYRKDKGGSGLGLAISKEIIEQHGGKIGVYSETNEGSTFYFELPVI
ncbi:MAG: PAS domain S-box protein [SAR324 cluster bacterium]|nr:PAS domain S-box protein [SAR324 cluster bacterium]